MANEVDSSAYLSTRFDEPCTAIRDALSIHDCDSVLPDFALDYGVTKNRHLTEQIYHELLVQKYTALKGGSQ